MFQSADPEVIYLQGSGGVNTAKLTFKVINEHGFGVANRWVGFTLNTEVGGLSLATQEALTNAAGEVSVQVTAGDVATPVRVVAEVLEVQEDEEKVGTGVKTESLALTLTTGIADQQHFSLSVDKLNPEAWEYADELVNVTASLADRNGNPVMDGTQVNFMAESGMIDASCLTVAGQCSVVWRSQFEQNRPTDHRATLLAYALGNEFFHDANGDGRYSSNDGEAWDNRTSSGLRSIYVTAGDQRRRLFTLNELYDEPFIDVNHNGIFDEPFSDENANGRYDFLEAFVDYNQNGRYDGDTVTTAGETGFLDMNGDQRYQGGGIAVAEWFDDINFNGQWDEGEAFVARQDILGATEGYDDGVVTLGGVDYVGGEAYSDGNEDGVFSGPGFSDLSEPWLDKNEDGVRSVTEPFVDFNRDGVFNARNGFYDGFLCDGSAECGAASTYIRRAISLVMASSHIHYLIRLNQNGGGCFVGDVLATNMTTVSENCSLSIANGETVSLAVYISDTADQVLPEGTSISSSTTVGNATQMAETITSSNQDSGHWFNWVIADADPIDGEAAEQGEAEVVVTTPKGIETRFGFGYSLD